MPSARARVSSFVKGDCFQVGGGLVHCKTHLPSPSFALMNERTAAATSSPSLARVTSDVQQAHLGGVELLRRVRPHEILQQYRAPLAAFRLVRGRYHHVRVLLINCVVECADQPRLVVDFVDEFDKGTQVSAFVFLHEIANFLPVAEPTFFRLLKPKNSGTLRLSSSCLRLRWAPGSQWLRPYTRSRFCWPAGGQNADHSAGAHRCGHDCFHNAGAGIAAWMMPPLYAFVAVVAGSISPEVLAPARRQCRINGRAGDRPMTQPALDRRVSCPLMARACRSMWDGPGRRRTPRPFRDEHNECLIKCFDDCRECDRARQNHPRGDALLKCSIA
jgi:hypothetical protein